EERRSAPRLPRRGSGLMLELKNVDAFYGLGHILHGLSLSVSEGEVVALLGRNGAGKTTTLRSITGLTPPKRGPGLDKGADNVGLGPHVIPPNAIPMLPQPRA